jgi:hypothetical protein
MTDEDFKGSSRAIALLILRQAEARKLTPEDTASLALAALVEVVGQSLGPIEAIERLRDVADMLERPMLTQH